MGVMVYSLLWVMQDVYHQPKLLGRSWLLWALLTSSRMGHATAFLAGFGTELGFGVAVRVLGIHASCGFGEPKDAFYGDAGIGCRIA